VRILNKTETKLCYQVAENKNSGIPAIIVAAGSSTRMGENKQLMLLGTIPVIAHTLLKFENSASVSRIILVTKDSDIFTLQMLCEKYNISKLSDIVCGGASRQESVLKGFSRLSKDETAVLIHDGARPLVDDYIITSDADKLKDFSAVTCAVKVKDTIKKVDENGKITKTLQRDSLVAVQTPQGVRIKDYLKAVEKCGDVSGFTDDTSIMEAAGFDCVTVEGSYKNIKITTKEDILAAISYID
jgi:2-C-methyl-D-erythritol 4-phosphate cytidylyltransferase